MTLRSRGLARSHDKLNYYISTTIVPLAIKLARMVTYLEGLLFIKSFNALITWSCKATWKTKIWPDANLTWWARTYKVTLPFDHMVPWGHLTNYSNFISSTPVSMATKLGTKVTYIMWLLLIKLLDFSDPWFC